MAARSAPGAYPKTTQGKSKVVERDQDLLRLNFVELRNCEQCIPAPIHEAQRFDQKHSSTFRGECILPRVWDRFLPSRSKLRGQLIDDHKSDVVPRSRVFRTRISETGDKPDLWICFSHWYRAAVILSGVKCSETKSKNPEELP